MIHTIRPKLLAAPPLALAALLATACSAPPDLSRFATDTAALRATVVDAGEAVRERLQKTGLTAARADGLQAAWERRNQLLDAMARYATSLNQILANQYVRRPSNPTGAVADAAVRFLRDVQPPTENGTRGALKITREQSRTIKRARRSWRTSSALAAMTPVLAEAVDDLEQEIARLDGELAVAERELVGAVLAKAEYEDLDAYRDKLRRFVRTLDPETATLEDVLKASNVANLLETTGPLAERRDAEILATQTMVATIRDLLQETRLALRSWITTHQDVAAAVKRGAPIRTDALRDAAAAVQKLIDDMRAR